MGRNRGTLCLRITNQIEANKIYKPRFFRKESVNPLRERNLRCDRATPSPTEGVFMILSRLSD
jgi:hypothetical protein